jgi:hypothetical protein
MDNKEHLELAFAGAVVHDMFNYLTVLVLFPLELTTQYLARFTAFCVRNAETGEGEEWEVSFLYVLLCCITITHTYITHLHLYLYPTNDRDRLKRFYLR